MAEGIPSDPADRLPRSRARVQDPLRARVDRVLGILLAITGAVFAVLDLATIQGSAGLDTASILLEVFRWVPCVIGLGVAIWPPVSTLLAPFGLVAWVTMFLALWYGLASAMDYRGGRDPVAALTVALAVAAFPLYLASALAAAFAPERRALRVLPGIAAASWGVTVAVALRGRMGARMFAVAGWAPGSTRDFCCGCAACLAVFLAIEHVHAHRRWLAIVGLAFLPVLGWSMLVAEARRFSLGANDGIVAAWIAWVLVLMAVPFTALVEVGSALRESLARRGQR